MQLTRRTRALAVALAITAVAAPAAATPYETFISIDTEEDLYDLHATGQIDDETLATLVEVYQRGIDLNRATREELYSLPNLTYAEVDAILEYRGLVGWITDPVDLVVNNVLTQEKLEAIAAFLLVSDPKRAIFATDGWVRSQTRWSPEDSGTPPVMLQGRVSTFQNLTVGMGATLSRRRLDDVRFDPTRGALSAVEEDVGVHVPKLYAKWETDTWGVIAGSYRVGFGQKLTFDNTSLYTPNGFYGDDEIFRDSNLVSECRESSGELAEPPCETGVYVSPDYRWREGTLGVAAGAKKIPLGKARLQAYGFASYQPRSIYQYEIYNRDTCDDPRSDLDEPFGEQCAAPDVFKRGDDPLDPASRFSYSTLPDMYAETTVGANVTVAASRRAHVGMTGYRSDVTWLVEGDGLDLDFQEWSRTPFGGPFGAVGMDGAYGAGMFDFFGEVTRTFDSTDNITPETGTEKPEGGGNGGIARWVTTFKKQNELEASFRYYDEDFKNPNARPIAAPDELEGVSARDEIGGRLRYTARIDKRLGLRLMGDVWQSPSQETTDALFYARGDIDVTDQYAWGLWTLYQNKDLSENGKGECFELSTETDDETGESIPCAGEKYQATARFRYTPTKRYAMVAQYQHEFLADGKYDNKYRQDASASISLTGRPVDDVRLRGRVRYLQEDLTDDMYLEESVWGYADVTYRVRQRDHVRLRYDIYYYLDDRTSTDAREPSPEHWLWLEYESRF